jgi:uncharacterized protein (TIGR03437 family)
MTVFLTQPDYSNEAIAPGELIRFHGAYIGPCYPMNASFDANTKLPTSLGGVSALIRGVPVPLISVQPGPIVGVAPAATLSPRGGTTTVQLNSRAPAQTANTALFTVSLQASAPVLGVNPDGSINSVSHPAPHCAGFRRCHPRSICAFQHRRMARGQPCLRWGRIEYPVTWSAHRR